MTQNEKLTKDCGGQVSKCTHTHECYDCIREEIVKLEAKLLELKNKLPAIQIPYTPDMPQYPKYPNWYWKSGLEII